MPRNRFYNSNELSPGSFVWYGGKRMQVKAKSSNGTYVLGSNAGVVRGVRFENVRNYNGNNLTPIIPPKPRRPILQVLGLRKKANVNVPQYMNALGLTPQVFLPRPQPPPASSSSGPPTPRGAQNRGAAGLQFARTRPPRFTETFDVEAFKNPNYTRSKPLKQDTSKRAPTNNELREYARHNASQRQQWPERRIQKQKMMVEALKAFPKFPFLKRRTPKANTPNDWRRHQAEHQLMMAAHQNIRESSFNHLNARLKLLQTQMFKKYLKLEPKTRVYYSPKGDVGTGQPATVEAAYDTGRKFTIRLSTGIFLHDVPWYHLIPENHVPFTARIVGTPSPRVSERQEQLKSLQNQIRQARAQANAAQFTNNNRNNKNEKLVANLHNIKSQLRNLRLALG